MSADPSKPLDQWKPFEVAVKPNEDDPKIIFPRGDLEPETPYYIQVQPENDFGKGLPSDPTHFVTVSGGKNSNFLIYKGRQKSSCSTFLIKFVL